MNVSRILFGIFFLLELSCSAHTGLSVVDQSGELNKNVSKISTEIASAHKMRVLLEQHDANSTKKIVMTSDEGFVIESPLHSGNTALFQESEICIQSKNKQLYMRCKDGKFRRVKHDSIEICNPSNKLTFNGTAYQGSMRIIVDEKKSSLLCVNNVDLEDYVYSVLASGMMSCLRFKLLQPDRLRYFQKAMRKNGIKVLTMI